MPLPRAITEETDPCQLAAEWITDVRVTVLLVALTFLLKNYAAAEGIVLGLKIISGYRTLAQQEQLRQEGRPTADPDKSTHLSCPATGVDLLLVDHMDPDNDLGDRALWYAVGRMAQSVGLRWGGGSAPASWWRNDPQNVGASSQPFPSDFNHFDLGPRNA